MPYAGTGAPPAHFQRQSDEGCHHCRRVWYVALNEPVAEFRVSPKIALRTTTLFLPMGRRARSNPRMSYRDRCGGWKHNPHGNRPRRDAALGTACGSCGSHGGTGKPTARSCSCGDGTRSWGAAGYGRHGPSPGDDTRDDEPDDGQSHDAGTTHARCLVWNFFMSSRCVLEFVAPHRQPR